MSANHRPVLILDLDNCIADDGWRGKLIDWSTDDLMARYRGYHAACYGDEPRLEKFSHILRHSHIEPSSVRVVILTARPLAAADDTMLWLTNKAKVSWSTIMFRDNNDHRSSVEVKRDQVRQLLSPNNLYNVAKEDILLALDDRTDILDMYHEEFGFPVARVKLHDVDMTRRPFKTAGAKAAPAGPAPVRLEIGGPGQTDPATILQSSAELFRLRNAEYGANYKLVGPLLALLFPNGVTLAGPEAFGAWHILELMIVKLTRLTANNLNHPDSLRDMAVYTAILEELTTGDRNHA